MKQPQILYYDDNAIQLDYWRDILSDAGFFVKAVLAIQENLEGLKNRLRDEWWQVIIADISLVENDPSNELGLHLVQQSNPIIPKMILTPFPNWRRAKFAKRNVEKT
jgi:CheY-like chemotaxis protein